MSGWEKKWQSSVQNKLLITYRNILYNSQPSTFYSPLSVTRSLSLKHTHGVARGEVVFLSPQSWRLCCYNAWSWRFVGRVGFGWLTTSYWRNIIADAQTCQSFLFSLNDNKQLWAEEISVSTALFVLFRKTYSDSGTSLVPKGGWA